MRLPQFPTLMTFFITSVGGPSGANYRAASKAPTSIARRLARSKASPSCRAGNDAGGAYTQHPGGERRFTAVECQTTASARDRAVRGCAGACSIAASVADLHSANNKIAPETLVAENGRLIRLAGSIPSTSTTYLRRSQADGTAFPPDKDMTCGNWTTVGRRQTRSVGHLPHRHGPARRRRLKVVDHFAPVALACDAASLVATGGAGAALLLRGEG